MYALLWQTVSVLTPELFLCLISNKHKNSPLMSAGTVRHLSLEYIYYSLFPTLDNDESPPTFIVINSPS